MLNFRAPLMGLDATVFRNIDIIVANDIKNLIGVDTDCYTIYNLEKENIKRDKPKLGDVIGNNTLLQEMIIVESEENVQEEQDISLVSARPDYKFIYEDKEIPASIQPVFLQKKVSTKFKYLNKSKSKINSILNTLRIMISSEGIYREHNLEYHYVIPPYVVNLISEINNLKNKRLEVPLALEQYIQNTFDDRVDYSNPLDGDKNKVSLVIREVQLDVEGWIADDVHSLQIEYDDDESGYGLEFSYEYTYEKPVNLIVSYPIMIWNNLISKQYRTFSKPMSNEHKNDKKHRTPRTADMYEVTKDKLDRDNPFSVPDDRYYLALPKYDTHMLPNSSYGKFRIFSVLTQVDDFNPCNLFNIVNDLPDIKFTKNMLDFILQSEYPYIGEEFKSLFHIELWKNDKRDYDNIIKMDKDGNMTTSRDMQYKYLYRVVFNINIDLLLLDINAKNRLKEFLLNYEGNKEPYSWQKLNYDKFNDLIGRSNVLNDLLNLLSVNPGILNEELKNSNSYIETMINVLTSNRWNIRSVGINKVLTEFMEKK